MNHNDWRHAATYHGLRNQGSTCYLNSVLQVLFMTKEFRKAVNRCSANCENNDYIDPLLKHLFETLERSTSKTSQITNKLGITVNEQRDAAEYFEKILNVTSPEASQIFQGQLTHKNTCTTCNIATTTSDPFWSLPLRLESNNKDYNVEKGIENFFQDLRICGENQMYCERCDAKTDATIKVEMTHHPEVLALLLKRFKFDYRCQEYVKIQQAVTVSNTLQIPESQIYELYAFVEHFGELSSGHYTATIKSQDDDKWYNFNDSSVTVLKKKIFKMDRKSSSAYLLFYRKQKLHAAETLNQDISEDFSAGAQSSEQCKQPVKCGEICEGDEEAYKHHNYVDKNYKKKGMNARGTKDEDTKNSNNKGGERGDNQSVGQIPQKRKGDSKESGQEINEKSERSGCPKQIKQSSGIHLKNDKTYSDNKDKPHEGEQYESMSLMIDSKSRDKADKSKTAGGNKDTRMQNDRSYNMLQSSVKMAECKQNLLKNNQDQKKKEKTKRVGEHAERQKDTKRHCDESGKYQDNQPSDDDSQSRVQQNQGQEVERQIMKDKNRENRHDESRDQYFTQTSGSKGLTENQPVIQSDNRLCNVGEDGMGGISSMNEDHTINTQSSIKAKPQKTAEELNYKECKLTKGELITSQNLSLNDSPSLEPQECSNNNDAGEIENCHEGTSSAKNIDRKVENETERKQREKEKQNASDKKGKKKTNRHSFQKIMSCGLCVPCKKD